MSKPLVCGLFGPHPHAHRTKIVMCGARTRTANFYTRKRTRTNFQKNFQKKKGISNLKYLLPSDEGILQFLSYSSEIWSRDQFFQKNQLCFYVSIKISLK